MSKLRPLAFPTALALCLGGCGLAPYQEPDAQAARARYEKRIAAYLEAFERERARVPVAAAPKAATLARAPEPAPQPGALRLLNVAPGIYELTASGTPRPIEARSPRRPYRLEVANGTGAPGMARRVAARIAGKGRSAARLTNQRPFAQARTEVQYRPGYEAEAAELAGRLPRPAVLVKRVALGRADVRVVIGRDLPVQALERSSPRSRA